MKTNSIFRSLIGLHLACLFLAFSSSMFAQSAVDTLVCGDTLTAFYDPIQGGQATDSFYVWLGNCQEVVRFDFTTADIPDGADIYYLDLNGNLSQAGSMPYFGGNCSGSNYFTNPVMFPPMTALDPLNCLPGFVELYGRGIPYQDSLVRRFSLPSDFMLSGTYQESARLHLTIPPGVVAILFVVQYNPSAYTILNAVWDCSPQCCIMAIGDTVCAGDSIYLDTDREAISYSWTGPNGFSSSNKSPIIPAASPADEGWYIVEGTYLFGCVGLDSVYVQVEAPNVSVSPTSATMCLGDSVQLNASGASSYAWMTTNGLLATNSTSIWGSTTDTTMIMVIGTDGQGCQDSAYANLMLQELTLQLQGQDPVCQGANNGTITATVQNGQGPYQIRLLGGTWQAGLHLIGLTAGTHMVEVQDAQGCTVDSTIVLNDPQAMSLTASGSSPSCPGQQDGSITLAVQQGQAPYQVRTLGGIWQGGTTVNGLEAGLHLLEIQDNLGCIAGTSYNLEDPMPLSVTYDLSNPSCANTCDGSILLIPSGGTAPYSYRMAGADSDSLEASFCEGSYVVEVIDANGCSWSNTLTMTAPAPVEASLETIIPSCLDQCDGQLTITASGGQAPYSYFLDGASASSNMEDLCVGIFQIEIVDAYGCPFSIQTTVEAPDTMIVEVVSTDPLCVEECNGSFNLQVSGGMAPYSFLTDDTPSTSYNQNLCAGRYPVEILDAHGCSWTSAVELINPVPISASLEPQDPSCEARCDGQVQIIAEGGMAPYQYLIRGALQPSALATGFCAGSYPIEIQDANGCIWQSAFQLNTPEPLDVAVATSPPSCLGACDGEVAVMPFGGFAPYQYWVNDNLVDSVSSDLCVGRHELTVVDANGCETKNQFEVEATEQFSIELGDMIQVAEGNKANLTVESSHSLASVIWQGICEEDCGPNLSYAPTETELIHVRAISTTGCEASDSIWISVQHELACDGSIFSPTAFSPNGDGVNDQFTLYAQSETDITLISRLMIFNQWGKPVFDQANLTPNDLSAGWDGFSKGSASPEGTFMWVASFVRSSGLSLECSGSVVLLR